MPTSATDTRLHTVIARRENAMREDLRRYVDIPTGFNHAEGLDEIRALVTGRCEALGARTEMIPGGPRPNWLRSDDDAGGGAGGRVPPSAICRGPQATPGVGPSILIASHLDTVFDPRGPFLKLQWTDGGAKALGPGVVDMKGGIVIALHALEALTEAGHSVNWTYFFNSDEETGTYHSASALMEEAKRHTWGLATEPALPDGSLAIERKGSGQFIVEAFGKSAHAGRDFEKGVNAVYLLARAMARVEGLTDLSRGVTVNIGPLKGGLATNIVPDYASAWGNVRYPTPEDGERFRVALESIGGGGASSISGEAPPPPGTVRIRHSLNRPAKPLTPATQQLASTAREVAESLGQKLPFASTGGVCDGNLMQAAGLPTIDSLGVRGGGLHTHQEWIETRSLVERCQLFAGLLLRLSVQS
jgi:glutamate carboxypeptidase